MASDTNSPISETESPMLGDRLLDHWTVNRMVEWVAGEGSDPETNEALQDDLIQVATDLAGPEPTPLDRLLAETAAFSWFALRSHESSFVTGETMDNHPESMSECEVRRLDRAHRRFLSTVRVLTTVRKLRPTAPAS